MIKNKARLAQALRTNLMRRKEQARQRRQQENNDHNDKEPGNQNDLEQSAIQ